ncbi:MAG: tRNA (N(6)-L-threonylcarbamoyladenosine(37)-C(2))-methylthiotransferase MtaB [Deltaproteobacteria bacterium]|nr:tRNA (N(6)-L-threonylcarbamoyladenosine(37)-C(2))-methylthiotransferase MtaB [Deltaproteobacteria bacterium]
MPTATLLTLGCKVNQYESRGMVESLVKAGYVLAPQGQAADLTVINTCTVTQKADLETRALVRRAHRTNPLGRCVVVGCYAQVRPEELKDLPGVILILGQEYKHEFLRFLPQEKPKSGPVVKVSVLRPENGVPPLGFPGFDRTRAFFRIQDGCSAWCTYCIVPLARGPSRSMSLSRVIEGLKAYEKAGYTEVVLSGTHLGAWGLDLATPNSLTGLLNRLEKESFGLRLRLSSVEPHEVTPQLIETIRRFPHFCPHLHLPLQSGDDEVLNRMHRPYSSDFFKNLVFSLTADWPELCLGADVMVGFPGEDEQAFLKTRDLVSSLPLAYLHVFPYSKRPRTLAARMPGQVDIKEIKRRAALLREVGRAKRLAFYQRHQRQVRPVLIENTRDRETGLTRGLTDNYIQVLMTDASLPAGEIRPVRLTELGPGNRMFGHFV